MNEKTPCKTSGWRWVPSLYVFQGIPSSLVMTTSSLIYANMGVPIASFAFWTSIVCLPWSIKPLWAPFVERYSTKLEWVRNTQTILATAFLILSAAMMSDSFYPLSLGLMLIIALASASHDIACDGYYMMALDDRQQSFFVGIRSTFYRIAMVVATGLVPLIAGNVAMTSNAPTGWSVGIGAAGVTLLIMAILCRAGMPRIAEPTGRQDDGLKIFWRALRSFFSHDGAIAAVSFFFLYRLGEAILTKTVLPFLNAAPAEGGLGIDVARCGLIYGTFGVLSLVAGGVVGGIVASRVGIRRALWPMILMMNAPNIAYVALAALCPPADSPWVAAAIMTEQFGYGLGFTAYMLVMLRYVGDAEYKAAEYAIGTSIMSLSLILPGMAAGTLLEWLGGSFASIFALACVMTIPGMVAAAFLKIK